MINLQVADSLQSVIQTSKNGIASNVWFWIAIIEFLIIILSIITSKKWKRRHWERLQSEKDTRDIDVDTIFKGAIKDTFLAPELYKKLITVCHPDRFIDETKKVAAEELSKEFGKNQYNTTELERLGKIAEGKLEVKIF